MKFPNPASRYAIVGVMVAQTGGGVRVAVTGAGPCVFRLPDFESALAAQLLGRRDRGPERQPERPQQRHPCQRRIPGASGRRDGQARGRGGALTHRASRIGTGEPQGSPLFVRARFVGVPLIRWLAGRARDQHRRFGRPAVRGDLSRVLRRTGGLSRRGGHPRARRVRVQLRDPAARVPPHGRDRARPDHRVGLSRRLFSGAGRGIRDRQPARAPGLQHAHGRDDHPGVRLGVLQWRHAGPAAAALALRRRRRRARRS